VPLTTAAAALNATEPRNGCSPGSCTSHGTSSGGTQPLPLPSEQTRFCVDVRMAAVTTRTERDAQLSSIAVGPRRHRLPVPV